MQFSVQNISKIFLDLLPSQTETIIVAVSGGADSMALTLLAKEYAKEKGLALQAVTVDHRLREDSTAEAKKVHEILRTKSISHHILTWKHDGHITRRHERAREARYSLLIDFCKKYPHPVLLTAHHQQDQVETILMRFLKGSGPAGFRGIQSSRYENEIPIIRPLLEIAPDLLRTYLKEKNVSWIEDPSNSDIRYERTKIRQLVGEIYGAGYGAQAIVNSASKIYQLHESLENLIAAYAKDFIISDDPLLINQTVFFNCPVPIQQEYLRNAIWQVGEGDYPKPHPTITAVLDILKQPKVNGYKIAGCSIDVSKKTIRLGKTSSKSL